MSEDNEKVFDPTEAIKEIAGLRTGLEVTVINVTAKRIKLEATKEYKELQAERDVMGKVDKHLAEATVEFKHGCEDIFFETEEKKFPGGQIKMITGYEYEQEIAVAWAIDKELTELLKLDTGKFKKMCAGLLPPFVKKTQTGKMYIDADLTSFLGDKDE